MTVSKRIECTTVPIKLDSGPVYTHFVRAHAHTNRNQCDRDKCICVAGCNCCCFRCITQCRHSLWCAVPFVQMACAQVICNFKPSPKLVWGTHILGTVEFISIHTSFCSLAHTLDALDTIDFIKCICITQIKKHTQHWNDNVRRNKIGCVSVNGSNLCLDALWCYTYRSINLNERDHFVTYKFADYYLPRAVQPHSTGIDRR